MKPRGHVPRASLPTHNNPTEHTLTMKYRLKIADVIEFPVAIKVRNGGVLEEHKFHISAQRMSAEDAAQLFAEGSEQGQQPLNDFLTEKLTGWRGQKLVIGEDDKPAEFDAESLAALLSLPGASAAIYADYLREIAVVSSAEGRRKN